MASGGMGNHTRKLLWVCCAFNSSSSLSTTALCLLIYRFCIAVGSIDVGHGRLGWNRTGLWDSMIAAVFSCPNIIKWCVQNCICGIYIDKYKIYMQRVALFATNSSIYWCWPQVTTAPLTAATTFHNSIYGSHLSREPPSSIAFCWHLLLTPNYIPPRSSRSAFSSFPWRFSHCFAAFLQRHCVSLYRQCIRRAFRQRLLDNILPSCCCCWGLPLCVFIWQTPVNVPQLGQRLSLSPADWVLSLLGQLLVAFLLLPLYLLLVFMHVIERTLLTACQCLIYGGHSGARVRENTANNSETNFA